MKAIPHHDGASAFERFAVVEGIARTRRRMAVLEATQTELLALASTLATSGVEAGEGALAVRAIAAEIGAATKQPDRAVERNMGRAELLMTLFPETVDALMGGQIDNAHVSVILECGGHIADAEARARYEERVIDVAVRESPGRLRSVAKREAERAMPGTLEERHAEAATRRGVFVRDVEDAMSELVAILPSTLAHGIHDRLSSMAIAVKNADRVKDADRAKNADTDGARRADGVRDADGAREADGVSDADGAREASVGETRSVDNLRADLLAEMVLTAVPESDGAADLLAHIRAEVHVTVPVLALAGRGRTSSTLDGVQPIDAVTARRLAGDVPGLDRVLTHPFTGAVLAVDRYRPSAELRRYLRAVDVRCRFPGCNLVARKCDIDHVEDAALGGATAVENLSHACRRHHMLKHHSRWKVHKDPDGTVVWTSPTLVKYPDRRPPGVHFTIDDPDLAAARNPATSDRGKRDPAPF